MCRPRLLSYRVARITKVWPWPCSPSIWDRDQAAMGGTLSSELAPGAGKAHTRESLGLPRLCSPAVCLAGIVSFSTELFLSRFISQLARQRGPTENTSATLSLKRQCLAVISTARQMSWGPVWLRSYCRFSPLPQRNGNKGNMSAQVPQQIPILS